MNTTDKPILNALIGASESFADNMNTTDKPEWHYSKTAAPQSQQILPERTFAEHPWPTSDKGEAIAVWRGAYVKALADREAYKAHADKLAEALRAFAYAYNKGEVHSDQEMFTVGKWSVYGRDIKNAHAALAEYETSAVANESEVQP